MQGNPDVVVVGCGALGLAIAHHAAALGARVVALDRSGPGVETSARAAAQSVIAQTDPGMGALMHRSIAGILGFESATGVPLRAQQVGSVKFALSDWAAEQLEREVERATALGARVRMVSLDEARDIAPHTDPHRARAAWHAPDDIYFSAPELVAALHRAGELSGVEFRFGCSVEGFSTVDERIVGVQTSTGAIHAGTVVVAAGPWTAALVARTGVDLPVVYVRHQYTIRRGITGIRPELPSVRVLDHAVYARPEGTNLMLGTYEPRPLVLAGPPTRTSELPLSPTAVAEAIEQINGVLPGVAEAAVVDMRGGAITMTPDGSYLIDEAPGAAGLFFLTGCNVMGFSVAPAIGEDVATWITSGVRPDSLAGFAASRFDAISKTAARQRALAEYEGIYRDEISRMHVRTYGSAPSGNVTQ